MKLSTHILSILCLVLFAKCLEAQVDTLGNGSYQITLSDSLQVQVFAKERDERGKIPCYYLPTNLRISVKDTTPEFSFLTYGDDEISGGLMHVLLKWGLDRTQLKELRSLLRNNLDSNAVLYGSTMVERTTKAQDFEISAHTVLGKMLNQSMTSKSQVPLNAGGKLALSFLFDATNARTITTVLENPEELEKETITLYLNCRIKQGNDLYYQEVKLQKSLKELLH